MSALSFATDKPPLIPDSPICDDSPCESEILRDLCEKTPTSSDLLLDSVRSCIDSCSSALKAPLRSASEAEISSPISNEIWAAVVSDSDSDAPLSQSEFQSSVQSVSDSDEPISQSEFHSSVHSVSDSDAPLSQSEIWASVVSVSDAPPSQSEFDAPFSDYAFDETVVPETEMEASGGGDGVPAAERGAEMAVELGSGGTSPVTPRGEAMMRLLLPRFFDLVRSSLYAFQFSCCFCDHWLLVFAVAHTTVGMT